jgi:hypothetical protein
MNERILEIAKQSGLVTDQTTLADVEKLHQFAQYIVKECKNVVSSRANDLTGNHWIIHNNAVWCCYSDIQNHFED